MKKGIILFIFALAVCSLFVYGCDAGKIKQLQDETAQLSQTIQQKDTEIKTLTAKLDAKEKELSDVKAELESTKKALEAVKGELNAANKTLGVTAPVPVSGSTPAAVLEPPQPSAPEAAKSSTQAPPQDPETIPAPVEE